MAVLSSFAASVLLTTLWGEGGRQLINGSAQEMEIYVRLRFVSV
jgi:hypothetical protein